MPSVGKIPREFRTYARKTWGWISADIVRISRDKPETMLEKIAYWRSVTGATDPECR